MNDEIQKALEAFHAVLNKELGSNAVSASIFISSHEYNFEVKTKSPAQLKGQGVSMKDIRGNWIK